MGHRLVRAAHSSWAVVLAGDPGRRLRQPAEQPAEARPRPIAASKNSGTRLRRTLDRVALEVPAEQTMVVTVREQRRLVAAELRPGEPTRVLAQPDDRGTAPAILYATHCIHWHDPEAIVAVFPSDHVVVEERAFMRHVAGMVAYVRKHPALLVLLGAKPTGPDRGYGWIVPAEPLGAVGGLPVSSVRAFWEKPTQAEATACLAAGGLWSTFVLVARAAVVLALGRQRLPEFCARLAATAPYTDATDSWALRRAYRATARTDFSRALLQPAPPCLAVSALPRLRWSDWGTRQRARAGSGRPTPPRAGRPLDLV